MSVTLLNPEGLPDVESDNNTGGIEAALSGTNE